MGLVVGVMFRIADIVRVLILPLPRWGNVRWAKVQLDTELRT